MNRIDIVVAVVITYHPDLKKLERLLQALEGQAHATVVVDNGSGSYVRDFIGSRHRFNEFSICLGENYGVAAGHNAGIDWAKRNGKTHVVLFDQDSIPAPDMIFHLLSAMRQLTSQGIKVAAVGPRYIDSRNLKHPSFIRVSGFKVDKFICRPNDGIVESDTIISSGSLISLSTIAEVGGPLNELFIDQVDLEWCFRARWHGYAVFGNCNALLHHSLGEAPRYFLGRKFIHQVPLRHYYIFRNAIWLLFRKYVPVGWKFLFIRTVIMRFFVYMCLVSPRLAYFKMMTKGIWHGLNGRLGPLE